jgi:hypothetical protein
LLSDQIS